jgi:uracil-DNA glycosylase family 4
MNSELRREYLAALGLKSWTLRTTAAPGSSPAPEALAAASEGVARAPEVVAAASQRVAAPPTAAPPTAVPPTAVLLTAVLLTAVPPTAVPPSTAPAAREAGVDWPELRARVAACTRCGLSATRTQTVFGVGNLHAEWLIVGEAPGADEDRKGEPFVGRAGQLLNSMLHAVGLAREQVYIANVLKCRPPGNRDPSPTEATECLPYLERQIALLKPKIMLAVGRIAAQNLLHTGKTLGSLRQQVHRFGASSVPLIVTYHPGYLLRTPADKRKTWEDLKFAREVCSRV